MGGGGRSKVHAPHPLRGALPQAMDFFPGLQGCQQSGRTTAPSFAGTQCPTTSSVSSETLLVFLQVRGGYQVPRVEGNLAGTQSVCTA